MAPNADTAPGRPKPLVLASKSTSRARMLRGAGVAFAADAAALDEAPVKNAVRAAAGGAEDAALQLAVAKAAAVAVRHPGALVLGADQILECDGAWFDKPATLAEAAAHLARLGGRTHRLVSAAACVQDGTVRWHCVEAARLTMRPLSGTEIAAYIGAAEAAGDDVLGSVGGYRLEGLGAQLFERVDGDFFTVLGLPLLPLLGFLRGQ